MNVNTKRRVRRSSPLSSLMNGTRARTTGCATCGSSPTRMRQTSSCGTLTIAESDTGNGGNGGNGGCTSDGDCPSGEICVDGMCVVDDTGDNGGNGNGGGGGLPISPVLIIALAIAAILVVR